MPKRLHVQTALRQPIILLGTPGGVHPVPMSRVGADRWVADLPVDGDCHFALRDLATGQQLTLFNGDWYHLPADLVEAWWQSGALLDVAPETLDFALIDAHTHPYDRDGRGRMIYDDRILLELLPRQDVGVAVTMTAGPLDRQRRRIAALCRHRPWIIPLLWVHARQDSPEQVEVLLRDHGFRGLKFHPTVDKYASDGPSMDPFLRLAERYDVPVQIHSATDDRSRPERIASLAARHPRVPVIMVHTELGSLDKGDALRTVQALPNLIAETSWTSPEAILETMELLGTERTLYGTDATVDGYDQYDRHSVPDCHGNFVHRLPDVVARVREMAPPHAFADWARWNAIRLYRIRLAPVMALRHAAGRAAASV